MKDAALQDGPVQKSPFMMTEMKVAMLFAVLLMIPHPGRLASGHRQTLSRSRHCRLRHLLPLHDRGLVTGPVSISQNALVQLPRLRPGQLGDEVDAPRALEVGESVPAVGDQVLCEVGPGGCLVNELYYGLDLLAEVFVRYADDRHVHDCWMSGKDVLGLLRIDVDPAGDDNVTLPVGQIQVPVRVNVANVPDRAGRTVA